MGRALTLFSLGTVAFLIFTINALAGNGNGGSGDNNGREGHEEHQVLHRRVVHPGRQRQGITLSPSV